MQKNERQEVAKHRIMRLLMALALLVMCLNVQAEEPEGDRFKVFWGKVDQWLSDRYFNVSVDTNYIIRPHTRWTVMARYNLTGTSLDTRNMLGGTRLRTHSSNKSKNTVSLAGSYTGITMALTFNPSSLVGWYNDFEYNTNEYYNRMGFDIIFQRGKNVRGWSQWDNQPRVELSKEMLSLRSFNFNYYYAFNYKRFSYPAAFSQSFIQRRSAGSFMLGASMQWQKLHTTANTASTINDMVVLKATNIGLGAGYGYNFVIHKDWLLHTSALPTIIIFSKANIDYGNESMNMPNHFPEFIMVGRLALVRNWGRYFAGATMVFNYTLIGDRDRLQVGNAKWRLRGLVGFRF